MDEEMRKAMQIIACLIAVLAIFPAYYGAIGHMIFVLVLAFCFALAPLVIRDKG